MIIDLIWVGGVLFFLRADARSARSPASDAADADPSTWAERGNGLADFGMDQELVSVRLGRAAVSVRTEQVTKTTKYITASEERDG